MTAMNDIVTRRQVGGAYMLALRFPSGALKGAGAAMMAAMGEEGRLVSDLASGVASGEVGDKASLPWRFESLVQDEEEAFLLGPDFGESLPIESLDDTNGFEEGMSRLLILSRAMSRLQAEGHLPRGIVSSGILFGGEDRVLILPPTAAAKALTARGAQARAAAVARLSSPRLPASEEGPEADASFLLAQAAYRFATGKGAFESEAGEAGSVASSARDWVPTGLAAPRLESALAAIVDRALADPGNASLVDWVEALTAAAAKGWTRELESEEESELRQRGAGLEATARSRRRRADFFRKRGGILIAAAAVIVVLALIGTDMARAQRDRPDYSWLTPRELVQRYYLAIEGLDLESLEACGEAKAIKSDQNYLVNLVVLTKTRIAYEGKSPVVRAVDWIAQGKSALAPTDFLYGIAGLSLSGGDVSAGATRAAIRAEYSLWSLDRKDDPSGDPGKAITLPLEEKRVDLLRLERGKRGWQIVGLDRSLRN